jgi:hypothetical protein
MKLSLRINRHTTASELIHLGNFFTALGMNSGAKVFAAPTDAAELDEGDITFIHPTQEYDLIAGEIGTINTGINIVEPEAPKKRRRTKAEIEAAAKAEEQDQHAYDHARNQPDTAEDAAGVHAASAIAPGEPGNEQPAATQPATEPAAEPMKTEPATESPSERQVPTHATLNMKATAVAKKIGPDKIKAKIGELGGKLISTLSPEALVEFDSWLDAQ